MGTKMLSVVKRYYSSFYATSEQIKEIEGEEEFCVHQHHNGLCVLTLGPNHPIIKDDLKVLRVDFNVGNADRSKNSVRGKKKKGGLQLQPQSILCRIYTDEQHSTSEKNWNMYACIKGTLIEPNLSLLEHPELVQQKYDTEGYIGIIQPYRSQTKIVTDSLLPELEYLEYHKKK